MKRRPSIRIQHGADNPYGLVTNADSGDIIHCVRRVELDVPAGPSHRVTATVHVISPEIDVTTDNAQWRGLDKVPTEALRAELARRDGIE